MWKPLSLILVGATASFITSAYHGAGIAETVIVGILASNAALIVWAAGSYVADRTWRPIVDADTLGKGLCPSCRTFNSLGEVTSDDPHCRIAECHACDERFAVSMRSGRIVADRLGKSAD